MNQRVVYLVEVGAAVGVLVPFEFDHVADLLDDGACEVAGGGGDALAGFEHAVSVSGRVLAAENVGRESLTYHVVDVFRTVQGEGYWSGRSAVFCRFSRCNLWSGRESDRHRAVCQFCDTEFTDSTRYDRDELVDAIADQWGPNLRNAMVVLTGGEPFLQVDTGLLNALKNRGFFIAAETNGTIARPDGVDWLCVSPKVNAELVIHSGDELKLVYPQGPSPSVYVGLRFDHFWLSPMDGPNLADNIRAAIEYVHAHPQWRLNVQTHKLIGVK